MQLGRFPVALAVLLLSISLHSQSDKITIPAGSPEDQALQVITAEPDAAKKPAMYEDFLKTFASNPQAVAYANWQLEQYYQTTGDLPKALDYGDKALAVAPHNFDILVSQATIAQQLKDNGKIVQYCAQAGAAYNAIGKDPKPEGVSDQDFASSVEDEKKSAKNSYDFFEATAFNAIASETDARKRVAYIELFTPAFPNSTFADPLASFAMLSFTQLKDTPRLIAYGEKSLATNPNSLPVLLLMANAYVDDPKPGSVAKAVSYAQKAIAVAKADAPDADRTRKVSAGAAHSTLGHAYMKQDKTLASIPELKSACALLKGEDDQSYATALYYLGFAYAKINKLTEAREVLMEAVKIQGPVQPMSQELLTKVNTARAKQP
ncbi:MAG: tetratricopeptide repeat protein [Terriglobales bacterium]